MNEEWNKLGLEEQKRRREEAKNDNAGILPFPVKEPPNQPPLTVDSERQLELVGLKEFLIQPHISSLVRTYIYFPLISSSKGLSFANIADFTRAYKNKYKREIPQNVAEMLLKIVSDKSSREYIKHSIEKYDEQVIRGRGI
jgi:hypothetical protein